MLSIPQYTYASIKHLLPPPTLEDQNCARKLVEADTFNKPITIQDATIIQQLFTHFAYTDYVVVRNSDELAKPYCLQPMERQCFRIAKPREPLFKDRTDKVYTALVLDTNSAADNFYFKIQKFTESLVDIDTRTLSKDEKLLIFIDTVRALQRLHMNGKVHGNISTNTVRCHKHGNKICKAKLTDYKYVTDAEAPSDLHKNPAYYSPQSLERATDENASGSINGHDTKANDVYALGIAMHYLFENDYPKWVSLLKEHTSGTSLLHLSEKLLDDIFLMQYCNFSQLLKTSPNEDDVMSQASKLIARMLCPIAKNRIDIHTLAEELIDLDLCPYYPYSSIQDALPKILNKEDQLLAMLRTHQSEKIVSPETSQIIQKLFRQFADKQKVYIKKDSKQLLESLLLKPFEGKYYLCGQNHDKEFKGGSKKGKLIEYNNTQTALIKLTSTRVLTPPSFESNSLQKWKNIRIYSKEKAASLLFSGYQGFPRTLDVFQYEKSKKDMTYVKDTILVEQYSGNVFELESSELPYSAKHVIIYNAALALKKMHDNGYIHGDIKSNNILYMMNEDEIICNAALWDFGFIKKHKAQLPEREDVRDCPSIFFNACGWTYPPESLRHFCDDEDPTWTYEHHSQYANDMYAFGIVAYGLTMNKDPSWILLLQTFDAYDPSTLAGNVNTVLQMQSEIAAMINDIQIQEQTNETKLQLLALRMLHPNIHDRLTVDQLIADLEKIK